MNKKTNKSAIGEKNVMKCGMKATVIADRGSKDIDIQFEDGTVVRGKTRATFRAGRIGNPTMGTRISSHKSIVGEVRTMNCGQKATVIEDRNAQDIDLQFEDGTIVHHKGRGDFFKGRIANPSLGRGYSSAFSRSRNTSIKGLKNTMKNGMEAEVLEDEGYRNITVLFSDGTVVSHQTRGNFRHGEIKNPNYDKSDITGLSLMMQNGLQATCISYRNSKDIDVKFEDGIIVYHKAKNNFIRGRIAHPEIDPYQNLRHSILGNAAMMNCGMEATVIADRNSNDIDVRFSDGTIVEHKTRSNFRNRSIANPNLLSNSLPEQIIFYFIHKYFPDAKRNYRPRWLLNPDTKIPLEIDIWIPSRKTGIEYDGAAWHYKENPRSVAKAQIIKDAPQITELITVLERNTICHYSDKHVNYQLHYQSTPNEYEMLLQELEETIVKILGHLGVFDSIVIDDELINYIRETGRVQNIDEDIAVLEKVKARSIEGETRTMNCGMKATCVAYRGIKDIDVQFEDGTLIEHRDKYSFFRGCIANPNLPNHISRTIRTSILGESKVMNCGLKATVIAYENSKNITVQFEDGVVVGRRTKDQFIKGIIANPKLGSGFTRRKKCIGETHTMKNGLNATIIEYRNYSDIDIQFEDGFIVKNKSMDSFLKGQIGNPNKKISRKTDITGETRVMNCGLKATVIEYRNANDLDVQFENGVIIQNKSKDSFRKGAIYCKKR